MSKRAAPVYQDTTLRRPHLVGAYSPRPLEPAARAAVNDMIRLSGLKLAATHFGLAENTLLRAAMGVRVRTFVGEQIAARLAETNPAA